MINQETLFVTYLKRHLPFFFRVTSREDMEPGTSPAIRHLKREMRREYFESIIVVAALIFQLWYFSQKLNGPWTEQVDFNGAVWSQAGHNFLTMGIKETVAVPAPFYYGTPPVPNDEYYNHHPSLLALTVAGAFKLFGEHEWAARLVPVGSSVMSLVLLWLLVRSCAGNRVAALSAALFAFLPMELCWGQMVNFEACALMWMLVGFLGFRHWHHTGRRSWGAVMIGGFTLCMLTAWVGYILVLVLCGYFLLFERSRYYKLALLLLGIAATTFALFLLQIHLALPGSFSDLMDAFRLRAGHSDGQNPFTTAQWLGKVGNSLARHFPPLFLVLAIAGLGTIVTTKRNHEKFNLAWVAGCFAFTNALYDLAFKNASYIHDYASFYFIVPVAILGGMGLDSLLTLAWKKYPRIKPLHACLIASLALFVLGYTGYRSAQNLRSQALVLDGVRAEPRNLIPLLGRLIRNEFPDDTLIMANFDRYFTPPLYYYAHTKLANGLMDHDDWDYYISNSNEKLGGIIWLGDEDATGILSLFKPGETHIVNVEGVDFCIWKPAGKPGLAATH